MSNYSSRDSYGSRSRYDSLDDYDPQQQPRYTIPALVCDRDRYQARPTTESRRRSLRSTYEYSSHPTSPVRERDIHDLQYLSLPSQRIERGSGQHSSSPSPLTHMTPVEEESYPPSRRDDRHYDTASIRYVEVRPRTSAASQTSKPHEESVRPRPPPLASENSLSRSSRGQQSSSHHLPQTPPVHISNPKTAPKGFSRPKQSSRHRQSQKPPVSPNPAVGTTGIRSDASPLATDISIADRFIWYFVRNYHSGGLETAKYDCMCSQTLIKLWKYYTDTEELGPQSLRLKLLQIEDGKIFMKRFRAIFQDKFKEIHQSSTADHKGELQYHDDEVQAVLLALDRICENSIKTFRWADDSKVDRDCARHLNLRILLDKRANSVKNLARGKVYGPL